MSDGWVAWYKITLRNMCDHDEVDAEDLVKTVLKEEGIFGYVDMDDCELVRLEKLDEGGE